jgi:hypothetical protein
LKKLFVVVLVVFAIVSIAKAEEGKWNFLLSVTADSRYVFYGIDFSAVNDTSAATFGITASTGKFNAFGYVASSKQYFEWGALLDYTFNIGPVALKSVAYPFAWTTHKTYWGVVFIEEATINNKVAPITAIYSFTYLPDEDFKDLNGNYTYIGVTKELFGLKIQAGANYNAHYMALGKGLGGIISITKSVELSEKVTLDLYARYYINKSTINTDEQVVGGTLLIKL